MDKSQVPNSYHTYEADDFIIGAKATRDVFKVIFNRQLWEIAKNLDNPHIYVEATNTYLSSKAVVDRKSVLKANRELQAMGIIERHGRDTQVNLVRYLSLAVLYHSIRTDSEKLDEFCEAAQSNNQAALDKLGYAEVNEEDIRDLLTQLLYPNQTKWSKSGPTGPIVDHLVQNWTPKSGPVGPIMDWSVQNWTTSFDIIVRELGQLASKRTLSGLLNSVLGQKWTGEGPEIGPEMSDEDAERAMGVTVMAEMLKEYARHLWGGPVLDQGESNFGLVGPFLPHKNITPTPAPNDNLTSTCNGIGNDTVEVEEKVEVKNCRGSEAALIRGASPQTPQKTVEAETDGEEAAELPARSHRGLKKIIEVNPFEAYAKEHEDEFEEMSQEELDELEARVNQEKAVKDAIRSQALEGGLYCNKPFLPVSTVKEYIALKEDMTFTSQLHLFLSLFWQNLWILYYDYQVDAHGEEHINELVEAGWSDKDMVGDIFPVSIVLSCLDRAFKETEEAIKEGHVFIEDEDFPVQINKVETYDLTHIFEWKVSTEKGVPHYTISLDGFRNVEAPDVIEITQADNTNRKAIAHRNHQNKKLLSLIFTAEESQLTPAEKAVRRFLKEFTVRDEEGVVEQYIVKLEGRHRGKTESVTILPGNLIRDWAIKDGTVKRDEFVELFQQKGYTEGTPLQFSQAPFSAEAVVRWNEMYDIRQSLAHEALEVEEDAD